MDIRKVEIQNFRSHKNSILELSKNNILIGQNNTGKTAFLDALDFAIGRGKKIPSEDDFYACSEGFDPKDSDPIRIIIELRETDTERFSDRVMYEFDKVIQYDEEEHPADPIKYIRICFECKYDVGKGRFVDERYFVDSNNNKLQRYWQINAQHLSHFPFFYLTTLRDINKEIRNKYSFWGKIKGCIDCKDKEEEIFALIESINDLLMKDNKTVIDLLNKLKELEVHLNVASETLYLQAFSKRSWELLDELNIYMKTTNSNLALPIAKHGSGTQNIAILLIFKAYLDILLPKIVDNEEATPIIGIEEPEAHVHPHAQRAIFKLISDMSGQKIISTHSPFIIDQANVYEYSVFSTSVGTTMIRKIPKYKKDFKFKYGLPVVTYQTNKYLLPEEELMIKRYVQYRNAELLFASLFILCEGDSEKVFIERVFSYYKGKIAPQLGISIISCEGQTYAPFLKIANGDALNLKWLLLSDSERETKSTLKSIITNAGFLFDDAEEKIFWLPDGMDFEKYYINYYGNEIQKIIDTKFKRKFIKFSLQPNNSDLLQNKLIESFIDKDKVRFADELALHVINSKLTLPDIISDLLDESTRIVSQ